MAAYIPMGSERVGLSDPEPIPSDPAVIRSDPKIDLKTKKKIQVLPSKIKIQ